jgi:hypothetical protein
MQPVALAMGIAAALYLKRDAANQKLKVPVFSFRHF